MKWQREPSVIWPVCCWIPSFWPLFVAVIWVHWASGPFIFFAQICCAQQSSTPVRGSALIWWVPNPLVHQGKPASPWSSKGQHVLMENVLSFEPACSYPWIKQNFTHNLKLSLLDFTVLLVQSHVIHFLYYAKARFSPNAYTLVGPLGIFCNRESATTPHAPHTHEGWHLLFFSAPDQA